MAKGSKHGARSHGSGANDMELWEEVVLFLGLVVLVTTPLVVLVLHAYRILP
jgi:hypothetical protein